MKRIIALLLALIMLFSLAACTGKNKNTEAPSISPDTTQVYWGRLVDRFWPLSGT